MTIRSFDYDAWWRDADRDDWRHKNLHWHCHASRMDAASYGDDAARRDLGTDLAPRGIRDWLAKPARTIRKVAKTPEEAVAWLRGEWEAVREQTGQDARAVREEARFGAALGHLRCGDDVCWGFWLHGSVHLHLAVVATSGACH